MKKKKKMLPKTKQKKSRKNEVDSPDSPSFLGLGDERKQIKKWWESNQKPNPNPNREKREIERSEKRE